MTAERRRFLQGTADGLRLGIRSGALACSCSTSDRVAHQGGHAEACVEQSAIARLYDVERELEAAT